MLIHCVFAFVCILFSGDSFDGSLNYSQVAVGKTMERHASMKVRELATNLFQVQNTNRSKRGISEWFGRAIDDSSNWVSSSKQSVAAWFGRAVDDSSDWVNSATENVKNWFIRYTIGANGIEWIGASNNDTSEWISQTAIDRDVWFFDSKENIGKWIDYVPLETSVWTNHSTIFHCVHNFILAKVVVTSDGDAVGGVIKGGPNGAAAKSVKFCVNRILEAGKSEQ